MSFDWGAFFFKPGSQQWNEYFAGETYTSYEALPDLAKRVSAKKFLLAEGLILCSAIAPAVYALGLRRKAKLKAGEERLGVALENASTALQMPLVTALAAPAIAAGAAYLTVQKLEEAGYIDSRLGNDVQTLMSVAAAGPMIQGFANMAQSAFRKGK